MNPEAEKQAAIVAILNRIELDFLAGRRDFEEFGTYLTEEWAFDILLFKREMDRLYP